MGSFRRTTRLPSSAALAFAWHERQGAFERLAPPWDPVRVLERHGGLRDGDWLRLELRRGPLRLRWRAEHRDYRPGRSFTDVQTHGPFARWRHEHSFEPDGDDACRLTDRVDYALPGGALAAVLGERALQRQLERVFAFRQRRTAADLAAHAACDLSAATSVALLGADSPLGAALGPYLTSGGHALTRLGRGFSAGDAARLPTDVEALVCVASLDVATREMQALAPALAARDRTPRAVLCASAFDFDGCAPAARLDGAQSADAERAWEQAVAPLVARGARAAHLRFGLVLSPTHGALAGLLPFARVGLCGGLGDGRQHWPWIALDDALDVLHAALDDDDVHGSLDVAAPERVTSAEFARALRRVLRYPPGLALPASCARLALRTRAEGLLAGAREAPQRPLARPHWRHAMLDDALRHLLGRTA